MSENMFLNLKKKKGGSVTIVDIKTHQILGKGKISKCMILIDKDQYVQGLKCSLLKIN